MIRAVVLLTLLVAAGARAETLGDASRTVLEGRAAMVRTQLTGPMADAVRKRLNSNSPVFAEVSSVKDFPEPTCKRLRVVITAPEATAQDPQTGTPVSFSYRFEMNLCADGYPPPSSLK